MPIKREFLLRTRQVLENLLVDIETQQEACICAQGVPIPPPVVPDFDDADFSPLDFATT